MGLSAIELWFITLLYYPLHYIFPGWLSLLSFVIGYLICRGADSIEPHFIESVIRYLAQPKLVRKR